MSFNFELFTDMLTDIKSKQNDKYNNNNVSLSKQVNYFYGSLQTKLNIHLITNYLDNNYADKLFEMLKKVKYNTDEESMVKINGMKIKIPRKQIAFGNPNLNYHFAGSNVKTYDWNKIDSSINSTIGRELKILSSKIESTTCSKFTYILVNNYLNQHNSIGYHSDDEKDLGEIPLIAGISLGQKRIMHFKSKITNEVIKILLPHNSLLIMYYPTNTFWKHAINKSTKNMEQRISLTFRNIIFSRE